jgi:CHAD domain-containing protein
VASRSYALQLDEPVPEGIARIARGRIDHAVEELSGESDSSPEEAVHDARKDMKKLRSLLRLVRGEIGDECYRRELGAFGDAARQLAGLRDADVMLETLASLDLEPGQAGPLRQALEAHRVRTAAGTRELASAEAIEILGGARGRVADWPLDTDGVGAFRQGLRRIYRRGRRDLRAARSEPTVANLHEWRKRVKDLWYHCSILESAWRPVMSALGDEAHELSDRLGDDHDLAVLLEWAREHADAEALEPPVAERRARLQSEAFEYGAKLYLDKPRAHVERLERWWEASAGAAARPPTGSARP